MSSLTPMMPSTRWVLCITLDMPGLECHVRLVPSGPPGAHPRTGAPPWSTADKAQADKAARALLGVPEGALWRYEEGAELVYRVDSPNKAVQV